ncbi:dysbindin-A isoform X2 [Eucyclogobius newberryi]|uniref:dysbindin-A isoform X2 n=1 Tax=Eucyclogobius newberryi TaxID=166745 RepID=UPI003B5A32A3
MFEHLKERLHSVQQDFSTGHEERLVHFSAGLHVLHRYEESWYQLHRKTKDCAQAAQQVDGDMVMLSAVWDRRRSALSQLEEQLQSLPGLITDLDTITSSLALLEGDFEEMESRMVYLETLCCQCEQQTVKQQHLKELESHRRKKRKELHTFEMELNSEHTQKVAHMEQIVQQRLKQKQKEYEEAFHQDVEKYLSSGFLTHREAAAPDVSELDHITVTNTSDLQALDDFLNSSSEDLSSSCGEQSCRTSLGSGSEETCSPGCVSEGQQRAQGPELEEQSSETDSEEPVVEADHEDILTDASL